MLDDTKIDIEYKKKVFICLMNENHSNGYELLFYNQK